MPTLTVVPFFGQQNKVTGRFLLRSCGTTKLAAFVARQAADALGWEARLVLPSPELCEPGEMAAAARLAGGAATVAIARPSPDNSRQRLQVDPRALGLNEALDGADVAVCFHETLGFFLKGFRPDMRLAQYTLLPPDVAWPWMSPLFALSWCAADLNAVTCSEMGRAIGRAFGSSARGRLAVWPLGFDADAFPALDPAPARDVDVLFVARASATNYTRHEEFIDAVRLLRALGWGGTVRFTDVTRYLRLTRAADLAEIGATVSDAPEDPAAYAATLRRARVAVALTPMYSVALREAAYCGAVPVCLAGPWYEAVVGGADWPFCVPPTARPVDVAAAVMRAVAALDRGDTFEEPARAAARETYQAGWPLVAEDLERLVRA